MAPEAQRAAEVFTVPFREGFLVYAPLAGRVLYANAPVVASIRNYLDTGDPESVRPEIRERLGGLSWLEPRELPMGRPPDAPYQPAAVTLFLTNGCNLRCLYCYASAGENTTRSLPEHIGRAAIDLASEGALAKEIELAVGFHGGGEPTLQWDLLRSLVAHARESRAAKTFGLRLGLATNGTVDVRRARWIAENLDTVTLSLDGPPDIQDRMRPALGGGPSSAKVARFAQVLKEHGTPVVVRCTVTRHNVEKLAELARYFHELTGARIVHFEPVFSSGRAENFDNLLPEPSVFVENFARALDVASEIGIRIRHSVSRLYAPYVSFCGCAADPLNVTPDGDLTACFEVCDRADEQAGVFVFGRFDETEAHFVVDRERLAVLRRLTIHERPMCSSCIAKWNCSGDCPAKWNQGRPDSVRCRLNRLLTIELLGRTLDARTCMSV